MTHNIYAIMPIIILVPVVLLAILQFTKKKYFEASMNVVFYASLITLLYTNQMGMTPLTIATITAMIISALGLSWHSMRSLKYSKHQNG